MTFNYNRLLYRWQNFHRIFSRLPWKLTIRIFRNNLENTNIWIFVMNRLVHLTSIYPCIKIWTSANLLAFGENLVSYLRCQIGAITAKYEQLFFLLKKYFKKYYRLNEIKIERSDKFEYCQLEIVISRFIYKLYTIFKKLLSPYFFH